MNIDNNDICANNCGKGEEESVSLKNCVACKMVKYCSRDCQKAHRSQHKKECRKRAAELHDEELFRQPPPREDCPICFLRMPSLGTGRKYNACCGKMICSGCIYAPVYDNHGNKVEKKCPFCRTAAPKTDEEILIRIKKRVEIDDSVAIHNLACYYHEGSFDLPHDREKALELYPRAAELGCTKAYYSIGNAYLEGLCVERNEKKERHYYELAAMGGNVHARHNLGCDDANVGKMNRALKHFMIAVGSGDNLSLKKIKQLYLDGHATKDDYAKALKAYQAYLSEIKSDDRDKAAAFNEEYKYYE